MLGAALMMAGAESVDLLDGLVDNWPLNSSLSSAYGGYSLTGYGGGIIWEAARIGYGARFPGSSGAYRPSSLPASSSGFSFSTWLYPRTNWASLAGGSGIAGEYGSSSAYRWSIEMLAGKLVAIVKSAGSTYSATLTPASNPTLNAWTHIVLRASAKKVTLAYNGVAVAEYAWPVAVAYNTSGALFGVGRPVTAAQGIQDHTMDDVTLAQRAWNDSEVAALYNGGAGKAYPF